MALKRVDYGLVSHMQCGGALRINIQNQEYITFPLRRGAFFHSFRVCKSDFHDLLREKPSSLFPLLGRSLISITTLMMHSMHLDLMARILVS